jgi:DNA-binding response OmpR family regulator
MKKEILEKLKSLTILYAEDEEGIRQNVAESLAYYVKEVVEAADGKEALALYESNKPDIILSDIHMPHMNGIEFIQHIRKNDRLTPVIMITAHTDKKYLLDAVELHMEKYIVKPIDIDELFDALEKCVELLDVNKRVTLHVDEDYIYDYDKKELLYKNEVIILNNKERDFLEVLISGGDRIISYDELQNRVWGDDVMTDSAVRSVVRNIRRKLPTDMIANVSGIGYKLV